MSKKAKRHARHRASQTRLPQPQNASAAPNSTIDEVAKKDFARAEIETVTPNSSIEQTSIAEQSFWSSPRWAQFFNAALWLLLLLGIGLRFIGVKWDEGFHLHPDERFLTMTVPELRWPDGWSAWFHTQSAPTNPFNLPNMGLFVYGQFPLLLTKFIAGRFDADNYDGILIVGRTLSAMFDAGSVLFLWLIARRLLGGIWAQIAAILLAFCALHIQHAHFFVVDTFATFWIVVAFWSGLKWLDAMNSPLQVLVDEQKPVKSRPLVWAVVCGLSWGLALACKISAALFAPVLLGFWIGSAWTLFQTKCARQSQIEATDSSVSFSSLCTSVLVLGAGAILAFRLGHPMAFRGESVWWSLGGLLDLRFPDGEMQNFWKSLSDQQAITNGTRDVPWNYQWFGRANYVWPLRNLLVWAVGWQQMLPAIAALGWMSWRWLNGRKLQSGASHVANVGLALAALWTLWTFLYHAGQFSKFSRYFLLMTPFVALLAAWCVQQLWRRARLQVLAGHSASKNSQFLAVFVGGVMVSGTVLWSASVASIYTRFHTRVAASKWLQTLPAGTRLAKESAWDDELPLSDNSKFERPDLKLFDRNDGAMRTDLLNTLDKADYVVVSSPRIWTSAPRVEPRFPVTTQYYRALFSGDLGFEPVQQWTSYPTLNLLGWKIPFPDDNVEEALTVYDHPRVVIFQKTPRWSKENAAQLIDAGLPDSLDEAPLMELLQRGVRVDESALPQLPSPQKSSPSVGN